MQFLSLLQNRYRMIQVPLTQFTSGKLVALRWLLLDITERKRLGAERERLYQEALEANRISLQ